MPSFHIRKVKLARAVRIVKQTRVIVALVIIANLLSACGRNTAAGVIISGSTSVQPYAEVLAEEYVISAPGEVVDVLGGGSSSGITAAAAGTADIGMSSRMLTEAEQEMWNVEIARDGLAIIVNPSNPIQDLSLDQIRDIYTARITDWSELGGPQARIHIIAREEGSGTRSAFEDLVMNSERITPRAIVQDSNGAVRQLISSDPSSIGFLSLGLIDHTVKAVRLDGVDPTGENVRNGSYSLYRPFLFVTNEEPTGLTRQFIDFTLSSEGQQLLTDEGLVSMLEGMSND